VSVTEYGYCPKCDIDRVELTMTTAGVLACHKCGNVDIYESRSAFKNMDEYLIDSDVAEKGS